MQLMDERVLIHREMTESSLAALKPPPNKRRCDVTSNQVWQRLSCLTRYSVYNIGNQLQARRLEFLISAYALHVLRIVSTSIYTVESCHRNSEHCFFGCFPANLNQNTSITNKEIDTITENHNRSEM